MFKILQEGANRILLNKSGNMSAVGINRRQPCFTHGTAVTEKRQEIYPNTMESREEKRDNPAYCAERKIRLSGPALGRPKKDEIRDKKQDYIDESERVEVERKFSLAKRKCGIGLIVTRLQETTCHCLAMSVLLLNLRKIGKVLLAIFSWFQKLLKFYNVSEMAIIQ